MKVLITGAFGFVGTNLSSYLAARGFELWALDVAAVSSESLAVGGKPFPLSYSRVFNWDELERIPWREVDAIVHLAGKAHDTNHTSDPQSYFAVNVGLTKRVLEVWLNGGGPDSHLKSSRRKFILFSSVKAVADTVDGTLTEDALPDPKTPYGQSKLEAEKEVLKYESSELQNFSTFILRPCMIHGPGNKGNLNLLHGLVSKGIPWPLGAFENRRSFASIGNICAVVEGLLKGEVPSGVYQVADDEALSTNELIREMAETMGYGTRIYRVPVGVIRCLARVGDVLKLTLNSERLKKLTESYVVSNVKIKRALGWERMPVHAQDGIRTTVTGFLKDC
jgi:nucleoside-diphosphate-sugar epimerase